MSDPYKVLGISPDATDEEIKLAYRELVKKYHPDNYAGNPLSDLATERMKEINQAYDTITTQRRNSAQNGYSNSNGGGYSGYQQADSQFADIRRLVNLRRISEAEELLGGVPVHMRDAEWFFLKGSIQYSRGWLDYAYENFSRAASMDPQNPEYRAALNQLEWQRQTGNANTAGYRTQNAGVGGCSVCDICTTLYCADCCCGCMGGDLIGCC